MEGENQQVTRRDHTTKDDKAVSESLQENEDWLPPQTRQASRAIILLLFFSFLMFSVPFVVFFGTKHFLIDHFNLDNFQINAIAVFTSVVSVNIIIVIYAYIAYKEPEYDSQGNLIKDQQSSKQQLENKEK